MALLYFVPLYNRPFAYSEGIVHWPRNRWTVHQSGDKAWCKRTM